MGILRCLIQQILVFSQSKSNENWSRSPCSRSNPSNVCPGEHSWPSLWQDEQLIINKIMMIIWTTSSHWHDVSWKLWLSSWNFEHHVCDHHYQDGRKHDKSGSYLLQTSFSSLIVSTVDQPHLSASFATVKNLKTSFSCSCETTMNAYLDY